MLFFFGLSYFLFWSIYWNFTLCSWFKHIAMHGKWKYFVSVELRMTKEKQGSIGVGLVDECENRFRQTAGRQNDLQNLHCKWKAIKTLIKKFEITKKTKMKNQRHQWMPNNKHSSSAYPSTRKLYENWEKMKTWIMSDFVCDI